MTVFDGIGGLGLGALGYCVMAVFLAALVRGYSGFGFSALTVASLTLVLSPVEAVPVILMLEVVASIGMIPHVWRHVDWRAIGWLCGGTIVGAPIGVYFLVNVPEAIVRVAISLIILTASVALLRGYSFGVRGSASSILATGVVSGSVNGVGAVGGLPVVLFFLASSAAAAVTRGSIVVFFLLNDIYATLVNLSAGLVTKDVLVRFGVFLIPLGLGVLIGNRQFIVKSPESFRTLALWLLIVLAIAGLLRTLLG